MERSSCCLREWWEIEQRVGAQAIDNAAQGAAWRNQSQCQAARLKLCSDRQEQLQSGGIDHRDALRAQPQGVAPGAAGGIDEGLQDAAEIAIQLADLIDADIVGQLEVDGVVVLAHR